MLPQNRFISGALGYVFGGPLGGTLSFFSSDILEILEKKQAQKTVQPIASFLLTLGAFYRISPSSKKEIQEIAAHFLQQMQVPNTNVSFIYEHEFSAMDLIQEINRYPYSVRRQAILQLLQYIETNFLIHHKAIELLIAALRVEKRDVQFGKYSTHLEKISAYFSTLEITEKASNEDIKNAYRKLILKYHPDKNQDAHSDKKVQDIHEAYEKIRSFRKF